MSLTTINPQLFQWLVLPALIFFARIGDVTLDTIRIILVGKGDKKMAAFLGFFEVLIWITVIGQIIKNINNPACYIGYAGGFAAGNFVGITLEEKLAIGKMVVCVFTNSDAFRLVDSLKSGGFGVTVLDGYGTTGPVNIVYTIVQRSALPEIGRIIENYNPHAFYSIEELKAVNAGVFPALRCRRWGKK